MGHTPKGEKKREGERVRCEEKGRVHIKGRRKFTAAILRKKQTLNLSSHE